MNTDTDERVSSSDEKRIEQVRVDAIRKHLADVRYLPLHKQTTVTVSTYQAALRDIDYLLSLLDSQAAEMFALRKEVASSERYQALLLSQPDAATRIRDRCVVHLQATADALDVRQETECPSGTAFNSEAILRRRIAIELQSLTLEGEDSNAPPTS